MKAYIVSHEAWYAKTLNKTALQINEGHPEIFIMDTAEGGGVHFEFCIKWKPLGTNGNLVPKLEMWDDSWAAFRSFPRLFKRLCMWENTQPQPKDIIQLLNDLEFKDLTERKNPSE